MIYKEHLSRKIFIVFNYIFLGVTAIICIYPMLHILAVSLSINYAVNGGIVNIWPVGFQLDTYKFVTSSIEFYTAFGVSVERTILGIVINMVMTVLAAYPLSKRKSQFKARDFYIWFFVVTMLFSGGLIPVYLVVLKTGLIDSIWALIIPSAVPVFNVILLQNFFKALPDELAESAWMDGAGEFTILFRILLPISKPVLATLILFVAVGHWNAWFDGMLYMNDPSKYPLQTFLQTVVVKIDISRASSDISQFTKICELNSQCAQIIIAMVPILCVYPFLQKYFTKGIILGSVKG